MKKLLWLPEPLLAFCCLTIMYRQHIGLFKALSFALTRGHTRMPAKVKTKKKTGHREHPGGLCLCGQLTSMCLSTVAEL